MNESGLGKYVAPTALGAAYALARMGLLFLFLPEQVALFDFNLLFLAGVLLGFTLRPVVKPIFWTRSVGTVVILLLLLGIGPLESCWREWSWAPQWMKWRKDSCWENLVLLCW